MKSLSLGLSVVVALTCLVLGGTAGSAWAHPGHPGHHGDTNPPPHQHDDDGALAFLSTLLGSDTLSALTDDSDSDSKLAVVNAGPDAAMVLSNGAATDLFLNGKSAAESILKLKFESDEQAALAILELAELFNR